MNISDLEKSDDLPWGLHDACLERIAIDWMTSRASIQARIKIGEHQETERRVEITVLGLVYCAMEPPEINAAQGYEPVPPGGPSIDSSAITNSDPREQLPPTPDGAFLHRFFVFDWNRSIIICARDCRLTWLDTGPAPTRISSGFHLPGDEIPDPK